MLIDCYDTSFHVLLLQVSDQLHHSEGYVNVGVHMTKGSWGGEGEGRREKETLTNFQASD